jgi:hypothetical protein
MNLEENIITVLHGNIFLGVIIMLKQILSIIFLFICLSNPVSALGVSDDNFNSAINYSSNYPGHGILTCSNSADFTEGTYMYCFKIHETRDGYFIILTDPISGKSLTFNLSSFVAHKHVHFFDTDKGASNKPVRSVDGLKDNYRDWID